MPIGGPGSGGPRGPRARRPRVGGARRRAGLGRAARVGGRGAAAPPVSGGRARRRAGLVLTARVAIVGGARRRAGLVLAALAASVGVGVDVAAAAPGDAPVGRVVFARDRSLWLTDPLGKRPPVEVATLPAAASEVRAIRSDAAGTRLLVDVAGRWYWAPVPDAGAGPVTPSALPCGPGPARLAARGDLVLCATPAGSARLVRLGDGKLFDRPAPAAAASVVERGGVRELVWDGGPAGVLAAPLSRPGDTRVVAPTAPLRGLLAAPDGSRGVGVYRAQVKKPASPGERDELVGFALDGTAARRRLIRDGVVLDWSWDSRWLLVQDGAKACIARAVGGQFKCWKGYTAVSLAPDGSWALVVGPRAGAAEAEAAGRAGADAGGADGERAEDEDEVEDGDADGQDGQPRSAAPVDIAVPLPHGPFSLYRARLAGPYTERPALVETVVDGAALWLPAAPPPAPGSAPAP